MGVHLVAFDREELEELIRVCDDCHMLTPFDASAARRPVVDADDSPRIADVGNGATSGEVEKTETDDDEALMVAVFKYFDEDGNGVISRSELGDVFKSIDPC